jgi:8-oxo-dGTP pyrophosphatase MutT (NUDIX family)
LTASARGSTRGGVTDLRLDSIAERLLVPRPSLLSRSSDTREAAVAAILRDHGDGPEILLIRRADNPRDAWSGHMAFPGGRYEAGDPGLLETAVRETREELGLDLDRVGRPLGHLDEIEAIARGRRVGMVIRPYVFALEGAPPVSPNAEVAEVLWAPLRPMLEGTNVTTIPYKREGFDLVLPGFDVGGRVVWGLTYQMLQLLFARLR